MKLASRVPFVGPIGGSPHAAGARWTTRMRFHLEAHSTDLFTIAAAAGVVALVTIVAIMLPAYRAASIHPAAMLK